jgi:hypothetical protein
MEQIVRDILRLVGIEKLHPEDATRIARIWFGDRPGFRLMLFRANWPWLYGRLVAARDERIEALSLRQESEREE